MEIFGTIGPSCESRKTLEEMFRNGMTGIRMNLSHGMLKNAGTWLENIEKAAECAGVAPELLMDLQGPELRAGGFGKERMAYSLREGQTILLGSRAERDVLLVPQTVLRLLRPGGEILLDDGKLLLLGVRSCGTGWLCRVERGGMLQPRKSIALPGQEVETETLTGEDLENLRELKNYKVTGVMLPFVRGRRDIEKLRAALAQAGAPQTKIYAKIENQAGIRNIDEIIACADRIVIARGDLGNAAPLWELPGIQKTIAQKCRRENRKFMVVTQMLTSMERAKVPTRAEVSDIFNAVLDGADAVMLTGETAAGQYPAEAIEYLVKTVRAAQRYRDNCGVQ